VNPVNPFEPEPPLRGFFLKAETLAAAAFRTIPYAGDDIADYFLRVVVPTCAPGRDRALIAVRRSFQGLEGGLQVMLMRMIPLP
jgi:hypothetical protein